MYKKISLVSLMLLLILFSSCGVNKNIDSKNEGKLIETKNIKVTSTNTGKTSTGFVLEKNIIEKESKLLDIDDNKALSFIENNYKKSNGLDYRNISNLIRAKNNTLDFDGVISIWEEKETFLEGGEQFYLSPLGDVLYAYIYKGEYDKADKLISKNIKKYPKLHYFKGLLYYKEGKYDDAIEELKKVDDEDVYYPSLYLIGKSYIKKGEYNKAIEQYNFMINLHKSGESKYVDDYLAYNELEKIYDILGDNEKKDFYKKKSDEIYNIMESGKAFDGNLDSYISSVNFKNILKYYETMFN